MKKKKILPLIILFLFAVLLTLIYIFVIKGKSTIEDETSGTETSGTETSGSETSGSETAGTSENQSEDIVLADYDKTQLKELKFRNEDFEGTVYKDSEVWKLKEEPEFPLVQSKAEGMATNIVSIKATQMVMENADLTEYGLSEPAITGEAVFNDGTTFSIQIGDKLPTSSDYYATVNNGSTVYVVPINARSYLASQKSALLQKDAAPQIDTSTITRISVGGGEYEYLDIIYDENNQYDYTGIGSYPWYFASGFTTPKSIDTSKIAEILENYSTIEFSSMVDYGMDKYVEYGLDSPSGMLYISYSAADTQNVSGTEENSSTVSVPAELNLYFGDVTESGDYYVRMNDSDKIYTLSKANADKLLGIDKFDLLNKFVAIVNILSVKRIDVTMPDGKHQYDIETQKTTDENGNESNVQKFTVDGRILNEEEGDTFKDLYQGLIGITIEGIMPKDAQYEQSSPALEIKFSRDKSLYEDLDVVYYEYTDSYYAVSVNGETSFYVDKRDVDALIDNIRNY